jgi:hypothetical protein
MTKATTNEAEHLHGGRCRTASLRVEQHGAAAGQRLRDGRQCFTVGDTTWLHDGAVGLSLDGFFDAGE